MIVAGIDVSKNELHVHAVGKENWESNEGTFANDGTAFRSLRKWLRKWDVERVVIEPTGRFHRRVHQSLFDSGFEIILVNPLRSRRFAEAKGELAKTDRVDAAMLAAYGTAFPGLDISEPKTEFFERFEAMMISRESLVDHHTSLRQTAVELGGEEEERLKTIAGSIKAEIGKLEESIETHLRSDPDIAAGYEILLSIPGIGSVNAASLCCFMPELGSIGHRQAASLLGVAPFSRDSGKAKGQRKIRGGRSRPRDALYMAAQSAYRWNPDMAAVYDRLSANGKEHKIVIVAIMRKLIILANVLLRDGREWAKQAPASAIVARG